MEETTQLPPDIKAEVAPECEAWNTREFVETATEEVLMACLEAGADLSHGQKAGIRPRHGLPQKTRIRRKNRQVLKALLPAEAMKKQKLSKNKMAALLNTSRTQVNRLLDPGHDITHSNFQPAAAIVGRRATIELL